MHALSRAGLAPPLSHAHLPQPAEAPHEPRRFSLVRAAADSTAETRAQLLEILRAGQLSAVFQPIVHLAEARICGFEGLIRGPAGSPLHAPLQLFQAARDCGLELDLEALCRTVVMAAFARLQLPGRLFLNVSPDILLLEGETLHWLAESGLRPEQVVIELTEQSPAIDYPALRAANDYYRAMGFEIALDDLGEGYSSLRLWSELRPDYVKLDKHFTRQLNADPLKQQFLRSVQEIASKCGSRVIIEGIEAAAEMQAARSLGIALGQGYYFARPQATPAATLAEPLAAQLRATQPSAPPQFPHGKATVATLLRPSPAVTPDTPNAAVYARFEQDAELYSIAVVDHGLPLGLISRYAMTDRFARQFGKELFGQRPCATIMDRTPLVVERSVSLHELSGLILAMEPYHLSTGFIVTEHGRYLGIGSGHDLLREITRLQITAARYANPLTHLPGNVPINEHIDSLLQDNLAFCACYLDLDNFKPYNDVYGFHRGDDIIRLTSRLLQANIDAERDFVGHIGGDDFIVLFRSHDWEARCQRLQLQFAQAVRGHYEPADLARGGIESDNRQGRRMFHPIIGLSLGAAWIEPGAHAGYHEVAAAASAAKKQAKASGGGTLYIQRPSATDNHGKGERPW